MASSAQRTSSPAKETDEGSGEYNSQHEAAHDAWDRDHRFGDRSDFSS